MSDSNGHDCWDNAVMYEEFDEEGNFFHGHECGVCQEFLCASQKGNMYITPKFTEQEAKQALALAQRESQQLKKANAHRGAVAYDKIAEALLNALNADNRLDI